MLPGPLHGAVEQREYCVNLIYYGACGLDAIWLVSVSSRSCFGKLSRADSG
jgi:hypothetical protein